MKTSFADSAPVLCRLTLQEHDTDKFQQKEYSTLRDRQVPCIR